MDYLFDRWCIFGIVFVQAVIGLYWILLGTPKVQMVYNAHNPINGWMI
jgi:hypothetical protein